MQQLLCLAPIILPNKQNQLELCRLDAENTYEALAKEATV